MTQPNLYDKICQFDIDGGPATFPFVKKVARDNGWSLAHAEQVIGEYRKFVYLAMVAGHPVSPSDAIDQAWHMHMLYTESYWSRLTAEILPRPLHHGPSKGGTKETAKFDDWYARTLDSYRREFGEEPPVSIWPPVGSQFADAHHFRRVNCKENLIVPVAKLRKASIIAAMVAIFSVLVMGCVNTLPFAMMNMEQLFIGLLCGGGALLLTIIFVAVRAIGAGKQGGNNTGHHTGHNNFNSGFHSCGSTMGHSGGHIHSSGDGHSSHSHSGDSLGSAAGDAAGSAASDAMSGDSGSSGCSSSSDSGSSGCGSSCGSGCGGGGGD